MDQNSGYEKKDIPVKPVLIGGALFIVTVLGTIYPSVRILHSCIR